MWWHWSLWAIFFVRVKPLVAIGRNWDDLLHMAVVGSEITMQSDDKMVIEWEARSTVSGLA